MGVSESLNEAIQSVPINMSMAIGVVSLLLFVFVFRGLIFSKKESSRLKKLPVVPGMPIVGNLLQLKEKMPYAQFTKWAEVYGPIYSIRTGFYPMVVLNSENVCKEAMITRFSSITTRKLSTALMMLTCNKNIVAMSDYDDFHKMIKKNILGHVLGPNAQKRNRIHRDNMIANISSKLSELVRSKPLQAINFRKLFESELFGLALKQAIGEEIESIYVEGLNRTLSKDDMFKILVTDLMAAAIEVDWRDFFPYLKWMPNKSFDTTMQGRMGRMKEVMETLIKKQKKQIAAGEVRGTAFIDFLLSEAKGLSKEQFRLLLWEPIIESSDTTVIAVEWALYELANDPKRQDRLYKEIKTICGSETFTEEHLQHLPYVKAIFHETLRKHTPAPLVPLRYAHEDTEIGGYFIPAGTQIAINLYGCNMDKNKWDNPEEWNPERFMTDKYDPNDMYKTMAFGAGKRVCAGSIQVMQISCTSIARMVQEFEWRLEYGENNDVDNGSFTTHKLRPMHVFLKPRN